MYGAIAGDIIGSIYEFNNIKTTAFKLFDDRCSYTDDSILTVAIADWLMNDGTFSANEAANYLRRYAENFHCPIGGYGRGFMTWVKGKKNIPNNSYGNGAAMRVSAAGWVSNTVEETLEVAKRSAEITHSHPEGMKGAQATATAIFLARSGRTKDEIRNNIEEMFGYDLNRTCDDIRPHYRFDPSCQGTVPEAIIAFLESKNFEDAIRLGVSLGGDTDTLCSITGGIAEAYYGEVPSEILIEVKKRLNCKLIKVEDSFYRRFVRRKRT
jgi:ADP-ribosylglycohydrolase